MITVATDGRCAHAPRGNRERKQVAAKVRKRAPMGAGDGMAKKASGEEEKTLGEKLHYPKCVENGCWAKISHPPPKGPLMLKLQDVDAKLSRRIKDGGVMSFHLTGCTGDYDTPAPGQAVAKAMAAQAKDARAGGGSKAAKAAAFFFHLGDIIYKDPNRKNPEREDMQKLFNEQFYATYEDYPGEIFAIPGNHDGKIKDKDGKSAIDHFMMNFCTSKRHISSDNLNGSKRKTMIQPSNGQKIDTRGSGVPPIFEWQIASYDRPPSGERFENFSMSSVQIRAHDCVRSRSALLPYYSRQSCTDPRR
jgi:hypothetical protein